VPVAGVLALVGGVLGLWALDSSVAADPLPEVVVAPSITGSAPRSHADSRSRDLVRVPLRVRLRMAALRLAERLRSRWARDRPMRSRPLILAPLFGW